MLNYPIGTPIMVQGYKISKGSDTTNGRRMTNECDSA